MASTVLTIVGDARGARRAIADVRADHARAVAAMGGDDRRAARERRRAEDEEVADARRQLRAMHGARQRAARERQQAEARERRAREAVARQESAAKARADRQDVASRRRAEREKTREAVREARKREREAAREAAAKARADRQDVASRRRAEREKTREAVREARKREREAAREAAARRRDEERITRELDRQVRERVRIAAREVVTRNRAEARSAERGQRQGTRTAVEAATTAAGAVASFGGDVHGRVQSARGQRASIQGQVIDAVSQVGVTDIGEVNRYVDMAINRALAEGMMPEDLSVAIGQAQTEFSALGAMESLGGPRNADARAAVFQRAIETAVRGRNMGVDPGEFSRLNGMFANQGLDQATQDRLSAWTVGAAQRGAVEPGSVTREAMGPIIQRMQAAMAAAKPENRQQAAEDAYRQAFAEIQVLRGSGESARMSSGAMATWSRSLQNSGTQAKMRENVSHIADPALRQRVQATLFDREGALRAELRNPVALTGALQGAGLDDPTAMANVFAGTGAGNAQSMQANVRRVMMGLAGNGGVERVKALTDTSVALSPERIAAQAALRRNSDQANLNRNEVAQLKALSDNTSELVKLSNAFTDWSARNPVGSTAATTFGGSALGFFGPRILEHVFGGGAGAGAGGAGAGGAAARIAGIGGRAMPFLGAAMTALGIANDVRQGRSAGQVAVGAVGDLFAGGAAVGGVAGAGGLAAAAARQRGGGGDAALRADVAQAMVDGLSRARIVARVDPHDAEVAATRARAGGGG